MIAAKQALQEKIPLKAAARKITLPQAKIIELRLRVGRCAAAVTMDGDIIKCSAPFSREDIAECFLELCQNSVHSFSHEIAEGYITLGGGHRVGFCGTCIQKQGEIIGLKDISSLNIRFAREAVGCAEGLCRAAFRDRLCSLIICGRPLSGKTTVLRDTARILGEKHRVSLVDCRGELAAVHNGIPALDVGENTDVLNGYSKAGGIVCALRSLSPEVILCDEIGNDAEEVYRCVSSGVSLVVTAHAGSIDELVRRPALRELLPFFDKAALLGGRGRLIELRDLP